MYSARLISKTMPVDSFKEETGCQDANDLITYCARVSNPSNQTEFNTSGKLLKYCIRKKHWSIFEMADVTFEVKCTRDIGRQILRHKLQAQEFSQRYSSPNFDDFVIRECRFQDQKNRQSSIEVDPTNDAEVAIASQWAHRQSSLLQTSLENYEWAIKNNIAKEQARVLLPEGMTPSVMYVKGSVRNWYHYCALRTEMGTQKEHRLIAAQCFRELSEHFDFLRDIVVE